MIFRDRVITHFNGFEGLLNTDFGRGSLNVVVDTHFVAVGTTEEDIAGYIESFARKIPESVVDARKGGREITRAVTATAHGAVGHVVELFAGERIFADENGGKQAIYNCFGGFGNEQGLAFAPSYKAIVGGDFDKERFGITRSCHVVDRRRCVV